MAQGITAFAEDLDTMVSEALDAGIPPEQLELLLQQQSQAMRELADEME